MGNYLQINLLLFLPLLPLLGTTINFEDDIQPIFEDYCIDCHGTDKQKSGFRVDRRVHLLKGGDTGLPAVIPGNSAGSYLIEVIKSADPEIGMPPKGGNYLMMRWNYLKNGLLRERSGPVKWKTK